MHMVLCSDSSLVSVQLMETDLFILIHACQHASVLAQFIFLFLSVCMCVLPVLSMTVFFHMVADHSSHTGNEALTVGWIVFAYGTTLDRTLKK